MPVSIIMVFDQPCSILTERVFASSRANSSHTSRDARQQQAAKGPTAHRFFASDFPLSGGGNWWYQGSPTHMSAFEERRAPPATAQWFATTHWSAVLAAGNHATPDAATALERLCGAYWYPV